MGGFKNQIGYSIDSVLPVVTAVVALFGSGFGEWQLKIKRKSINIITTRGRIMIPPKRLFLEQEVIER